MHSVLLDCALVKPATGTRYTDITVVGIDALNIPYHNLRLWATDFDRQLKTCKEQDEAGYLAYLQHLDQPRYSAIAYHHQQRNIITWAHQQQEIVRILDQLVNNVEVLDAVRDLYGSERDYISAKYQFILSNLELLYMMTTRIKGKGF